MSFCENSVLQISHKRIVRCFISNMRQQIFDLSSLPLVPRWMMSGFKRHDILHHIHYNIVIVTTQQLFCDLSSHWRHSVKWVSTLLLYLLCSSSFLHNIATFDSWTSDGALLMRDIPSHNFLLWMFLYVCQRFLVLMYANTPLVLWCCVLVWSEGGCVMIRCNQRLIFHEHHKHH